MTQLEQSQALHQLSRSAAAWSLDGVNRFLGGTGGIKDLEKHIQTAKEILDDLLAVAAKPVERK